MGKGDGQDHQTSSSSPPASPPPFDPLASISTPIPCWCLSNLHLRDEDEVQNGIGPPDIGCVIFVPKTLIEQTKLDFAKNPDPKNIATPWHSLEVLHFQCWVYLLMIARRITRNPDEKEAILEKNAVAVETCRDLIRHCRNFIANTYAPIFLKASWDPEKGKACFSPGHGQVKHMLNSLQLTGTDVICTRNGDLVRKGIFLYENARKVWFISPPGGPPKLSSSLAKVDIFPEPTQTSTDDHEDYVQNWDCIRLCWEDIHAHGFKLAMSSGSDETK